MSVKEEDPILRVVRLGRLRKQFPEKRKGSDWASFPWVVPKELAPVIVRDVGKT